MLPILTLLLSLLLVHPASAQGIQTVPAIPITLPEVIRQGDAFLAWIPRTSSPAGLAGEAVLRSPAGTVLLRAGAVPLEYGAGWDVFALGVAMDCEAGVYTLEIVGVRDGTPFSSLHSVTVRTRDFAAEDIPLSAGLTSIRTEPGARKEEEARTFAEVLARVDPAGVWLDSPFLRPVAGQRRTSFFGDRRRYLYATGGTAASVHAGIDFASPTGAPVTGAGRGRVVMASDREVTGKTVILEHLPGVYTIYMHLDTLAVAVGSILERGSPLGTVGSTGLATGPHLHWEFRVRGIACDPESPAFAVFPVAKPAAATLSPDPGP